MTTPSILAGRYEIGENLGFGGMSEVHRGRDTVLGRDVAVNGETRQGHYLDTIDLMGWARTFHKEGVAAGDQVATAATKGNKEDNIQLVAESEAMLLTQTEIQKTITLNEIGKEVKAGDVLGVVTMTDDFGNVKEVNLLAAADAVTETNVTAIVLIAAAAVVAVAVVVVFAKKGDHRNVGNDVYTAEVYSFTHQKLNVVRVSRKYLEKGMRVLIIDDFLANGEAVNGLTDILRQAECELVGVGICVEKGFQPGGKILRESGVKVVSLAIVDAIDNGKIILRED